MYGQKKEELPTKFIIVTKESMHVASAGHGYDEYTHQYESVTRIPDEDALKEWIQREENRSTYGRKAYQVYAVTPVKVETELKISLSS